jgi:hypothetical protein
LRLRTRRPGVLRFRCEKDGIVLDQFDFTPGGFRIVKRLVVEASKSEDNGLEHPTRVAFTPRISEKTLPTHRKSSHALYNAAVSVGLAKRDPPRGGVAIDSRVAQRCQSSKEVAALKDMRFMDDVVYYRP